MSEHDLSLFQCFLPYYKHLYAIIHQCLKLPLHLYRTPSECWSISYCGLNFRMDSLRSCQFRYWWWTSHCILLYNAINDCISYRRSHVVYASQQTTEQEASQMCSWVSFQNQRQIRRLAPGAFLFLHVLLEDIQTWQSRAEHWSGQMIVFCFDSHTSYKPYWCPDAVSVALEQSEVNVRACMRDTLLYKVEPNGCFIAFCTVSTCNKCKCNPNSFRVHHQITTYSTRQCCVRVIIHILKYLSVLLADSHLPNISNPRSSQNMFVVAAFRTVGLL